MSAPAGRDAITPELRLLPRDAVAVSCLEYVEEIATRCVSGRALPTPGAWSVYLPAMGLRAGRGVE